MHVSLAVTPLRRARGLLASEPGAAPLLLAPARSVHTCFMRRPIDVVFLDADLVVLKVVRRLRPWRIAASRHATAVLELPAGAATVTAGDRYALTPRR